MATTLNPAAATFTPPAPRPTIILLGLDDDSIFTSMYGRLTAALSARARVQRITDARAALTYLTTNTAPPAAILVTDSGIADAENANVARRVADYAVRGGRVVIGCGFSGYMGLGDMGDFFASVFGLPWQAGYYHRSTFELSGEAGALRRMGGGGTEGLARRYSMKGVHLVDVPKADRVYVPCRASAVESWVFPADPVDPRETPVAWTEMGEGMVGYVGDVNAEEESDRVILAMCGL